MKVVLDVDGMHCIGCDTLIADSLGELEGVEAVNASHKTGKVEVVFDMSKVGLEKIKQQIASEGYEVE